MNRYACCLMMGRDGVVDQCLFLVEAESDHEASEKAMALGLREFPEGKGYSGHSAIIMDVWDDPVDPSGDVLRLAWHGRGREEYPPYEDR